MKNTEEKKFIQYFKLKDLFILNFTKKTRIKILRKD